MSAKIPTACLGAAILFGVGVPAADAQSQPPLKLELNKLEAAEGACRVNFVVRNDDDTAYDRVTTDLVFFDRDGVILTRRTLELGHLKPRKTQVLSFPLESFRCDQLGEVLLNGAQGCGDGTGEAADCTERIEISHRGEVPFTR